MSRGRSRAMSGRNESSRGSTSFSRRSFLKGSGAALAATAAATRGEVAQAQQQQSTVVSGATQITLNVNGEDRQVTVQPRTSLLDVHRGELQLTGCKDLLDVY